MVRTGVFSDPKDFQSKDDYVGLYSSTVVLVSPLMLVSCCNLTIARKQGTEHGLNARP